ncbi:ExbD/TolR family protein, partial [Serratia marcescens]|uniref:ExbD/TolR family protein n=1 Tax=Serratia marcescens TaxID=615 RepID=UPI002DACF090
GQTVNFTQLADLLNQTSAMQPAPELQLEPDAQARYVVVDQVVDLIKETDVPSLGFVGNERYARDF